MAQDDPILDVFERLASIVAKMSIKDNSEEEDLFVKSDEFYSFLCESHMPKQIRHSAWRFYHSIAKKQREIFRLISKAERKRKREIQNRFVLYAFESIAFLSTIFLSWYGVSHDVNGWTIFVCGGISLVSFCALLYFHVGEYERVEKIVMKALGRLVKENEKEYDD